MTKKRFDYNQYNDGFQSIYDRKNDEYLTDWDLSKIEEFLNKLNEENKKLKEENEQLKQRNDRQAKRLGELYELMAKKDWESLTEIIDDFCSCEEQLQRESGTYGDFE